MADMQHQRRVMVDNQIRTFDVTDRDLLAAFDRVPREVFLDTGDRATAYTDRAVTVHAGGASRPLLPPLILARLLQALQPEAGESALDVFGATGYSAAILATMGLRTTAIESDAAMTEAARAALSAAGADVTIANAAPDLSAGATPALPANGFDVILINGASERVPSGFFPLLREGGRLGIIQRGEGAARALVYLKANSHVSPRRAFDADAPVLPCFSNEPGFVF
jgi:protein-L-isoaspartate(D-aspartate) O-methyltransferase